MTLVSERIGQFFVGDHRLEYTEFGGGDRWVVLLPGYLMPRRMHQPLARKIAASGAHVITLDLLGHGRSDRPSDPMQYSMSAFADHVIALLDHLGARRAVLGGTSTGANVALEVAVLAPERVQGLLAEMPVLDNGVEARILTAGPLLFGARLAPFAVTGIRLASRAVPRGIVPFWLGVALDTLDQRPSAMAAALHGLFFGRVAPPGDQRMAIDVPALVVGHRLDPVHRAADAAMLSEEITDSRLVVARSPLEWRLRPDRLDGIAVEFVSTCWVAQERGRLADATS